jgi:hypothetical protein
MTYVRKWDVQLFAGSVLWLFVVALVPRAGYLLANWSVHQARLWTYGNVAVLAAVALTREIYLWHLRRVVDDSPPVAPSGVVADE